MPRIENVLRVLEAFRRLDGINLLHSLTIRYPGKYHALRELCDASRLPRSTVADVLSYLQRLGVVERRDFDVPRYRLLVWRFSDGGVTYEIELDRAVAYVS